MFSIIERRVLITIGLFFLLAIGIVGGIIYPTLRHIKQIDTDTYNLRVSLEKKNEQVTSYRMALKQVEKIKKEMPNFSDHLFMGGQELKLITTLETLAAGDGVTQKILTSNLDSISNQRIAMSVNVTGNYKNVISYLNDLEHLPFFVSVSRVKLVTFTDRKNQTDTNQVSMDFDISLYVIP